MSSAMLGFRRSLNFRKIQTTHSDTCNRKPMNFPTLRAFLLTGLKNQPWLGFVRRWLWFLRAKRDHEAVLLVGKKLGFQPLPINNFKMSDSKQSDTLFILGSGSSVTELSDSNLNEIGENVSVGINVWIAHDFIPDVYSLESGSTPITKAVYEQNRYRARKLNRPSVIERSPKFLVLRPGAPSIAEQFVAIPEALRDKAFLYGRANLPHVVDEIASAELGHFLHRFLRRKSELHVLPDNGASVVRLIFLGLKLGFKKIVLVGIDLNLSPYFWFHPDWLRRRPELAEIFPRSSGVPHDTTDTKEGSRERRPYNTLSVIRWLNDCLEGPYETQLLTGSSSSALAEFLPLYQWRS